MQHGEQIWRSKTDDEVAEAARVRAEYTEEGERIIREEDGQDASQSASDRATQNEGCQSVMAGNLSRFRTRAFARPGVKKAYDGIGDEFVFFEVTGAAVCG